MRWVYGLALIWAPVVLAEPAFEDYTAALPEHIYDGGWEHFVGGGIAVFDCNEDGRPDLFAAGGENPARLIVNTGDFTFQDAGLPELTGVTGAYPLDVDADGHRDLFVMRVGPNVLLRGTGDCAFAEATTTWGLPQHDDWTTAFSAWWSADDSRPSMAIGNYVDRKDPDGPFEACADNMLLTPTAAGYDVAPLRPGFCPLSMLAATDARGRATLRISNDRHYYVSGGYEQMWDLQAGRFLTADDGWRRVSLWGMGIASRDLNGDQRDEVMLTSMGDQLLQIAQPDGTYQAADYAIGTYAQRPHVGDDGRPSTGWHAEFGDVNNDGLADLFISKGNVDQMPGMATRDPNNLLMQRRDGTFQEAAASAGVADVARSRGAALADFDGDGRLDLVVVNRRAPMTIYRNVTAGVGHWLAVDLVQNNANRDAVGARITVRTGAGLQSVQRVVGGGHAGGQLLAHHFGLGAARTAEVTVTWPDGSTQVRQASAGTLLVLRKP